MVHCPRCGGSCLSEYGHGYPLTCILCGYEVGATEAIGTFTVNDVIDAAKSRRSHFLSSGEYDDEFNAAVRAAQAAHRAVRTAKHPPDHKGRGRPKKWD